ncbi:MAG TPA: DoxX family protein [Gemmataceae bacterium]|nr:DoxX family protein [Gemmataceae bacterium]
MNRAKQFGFLTIVFLILLRLAIGWHFLYEGVHKLNSFVHGSTAWSSAGYFREAPGPLAWEMRQHIGDPDDEALARLTVQPAPAGEDDQTAKGYLRTPPGLHKEWEDYLQRYADAYHFDKRQRDLASAKLEESEDGVFHWLTLPWDATLKRQAPDDFATMDEQLKKAQARLDQLAAMDKALGDPGDDQAKKQQKQEIEDERKLVTTDRDKLQALQKIEIRGFRAVEKTSPTGTGTITILETPAERIEEYRNKVQQYRAMVDDTDRAFGADVVGPKRLAAKGEAAAMRKSLMDDLDKETAKFKTSLDSLLTPDQQQATVALPPRPTPLIWWIDGCTAWALTIIGGCLLAGLLTRTNCVLAAGFLLMTYFVSPPWPWLPTPPNTEGNYLFINKNVIEMFALLALATTASGRWFGLDAMIHWTLRALFGRKIPQPLPARKAA